MFRNIGYACTRRGLALFGFLTLLVAGRPVTADTVYSSALDTPNAFDKPSAYDPRAKISSVLLGALCSRSLPFRRSYAAGDVAPAGPRVRENGRVQVYVHLFPGVGASEFASLLYGFDLDLEIIDERHNLLQAWVAPSDLEALAAYEEVTAIRPPGYAVAASGAFLSEGDAALRADQARAAYGLDGLGTTVGAISDGVDSLAEAQAGGDLPAAEMINVIDAGSGDEGTGLLEIVHDLAPAAGLAFYGPATSAEMLLALDAMDTAGADVIVDDLIFLDEPVFEDGPIALAVADLVARDISYHTAAGNHAVGHYEGGFVGVAASLPAAGNIIAHQFAPGDITLDIGTLPGSRSIVSLQWNDRFGVSANDYDLLLYDSTLTSLVGFSVDLQNGDPALDPRPLELLTIVNPTASLLERKLVVRKFHGDDRRLEVNVFVAGAVLDHNDPSGSIYGHQAVDGAISVGAINVQDPGVDDIAQYSAHGPSRLDYPSVVWRDKPDFVAVDGVEISGAGGFPTSFFGTSAAAPHSAAIAALLLSGGVCGGGAVRQCLIDGAVDLGAAGFDSVYGHGRVDALAAANACLPPTLCGDANGDCRRSASDAFMALRTGVGADTCQACICDVDALNGINATDALSILQFGVGQLVYLACSPCP